MPTQDNESFISFFDGHWLREATSSEKFFDEAHQCKQLGLCYKLHLASKSPLREEHVRSALTHLYRKCPSLHFCFGDRDGVVWARRSTNPKVDFEVIKNESIEEVRKSLHYYDYSRETGPLFCARLAPDTDDPGDSSAESDPNLPHTSCILFGLHHGVGDGRTLAQVMGFFVSLLNDIISDKPINNEQPLGELAGSEYFEEELEKRRELLRNDPDLKAKTGQEIETFESSLAHIKTDFPSPNIKRDFRMLDYALDQDTTAKFIKKCRSEGVTVNSGFAAAANVALTDLLFQNDIKLDTYTIKLYLAMNVRRYSKVDIKNGLGIHFSYPLPVPTQVPGKLNNEYFEYARFLHEKISTSIKTGKPLLNQAYATLECKEMTADFLLDENNITYSDFVISNLGEITDLVDKGGEEVRPTCFFRTTAIDYVDACPLSILCHSLRGKFTMTFSINAFVLGEDVAHRFLKQIVKRMRGVVE